MTTLKTRRAILAGAASAAALGVSPALATLTDKTERRDILVMELLPPPGRNSNTWSGFALDGTSQRWAFGADREGVVEFAFREDRSAVRPDGQCFWHSEPAPAPLCEAVRLAVKDMGSVSDDPIFAAIEKHRLAHEAKEAAFDAYNDLSESAPPDCRLNGLPSVQISSYENTGAPICVSHKSQIAYYAEAYPENERAAFIEQSKKALVAEKRRRARAARKAGLTAAWSLFDTRARETWELLEILVKTAPTTRSGAAAAVAHVVELLEDDRIDFSDIGPELTAILKTASNAISAG